MSRWNQEDPLITERAAQLRRGTNTGTAAAIREAKRIEAELRDLNTPPERRKTWKSTQSAT